MRDLVTSPAWSMEDLGMPLPDTSHACSMCLPTWASVIDYEEGRDRVIRSLRAGYPRFFTNPWVTQVAARVREEVAENGEEVFLFPTLGSAQRAQRWIERRWGGAVRAVDYNGFYIVAVPTAAASFAKDYQRFTGELISSRMAEDWLQGGVEKKKKVHYLRRRLASLYGAKAEQVSVFTSGMSAITALMRSLPGIAAGKKTLQLEFPYVDVLKVQEYFGNGVVFLNECEGESFTTALRRIRSGEFAAVFTEVPSNPLLRSADVPLIAEACREAHTPFIVDDSVAGPYNLHVLPYVDVVVCSLTKWLSGYGDIMGGMTVVREDSEFAADLQKALAAEAKETAPLYVRDVEVLLSNLKDFSKRMAITNENGMRLAELLVAHSAVEHVWHPSLTSRARYEKIMTPDGGYGGLLSFTLKSPKRTAKMYDALRLCKGPSFGTNFSLVSPYTLLAHYVELDWAAGCGVPEHLIRVSCGMEDGEKLEAIFQDALRLA